MYLKTLKLSNFRKYGVAGEDGGLLLDFCSGVNLLVGENDSGKSCVIDAMHYLLYDDSHGWIRIAEEDFNNKAHALTIECVFTQLSDVEAKNFLEWVSHDSAGNYHLKVTLTAEVRSSGVFYETRAGSDDEGSPLTKVARQYLCATYLKPCEMRKRNCPLGEGRGYRRS